MALTRANVESVLIRRLGRILAACQLDGATVDGSNPDLADPIGLAVRQLGGTTASIADVADADLATLADSQADALLDVAELRALESCLGNLPDVDVTVGPERESLGQLGTRLEAAIARKRSQVLRDHGIGLAPPDTNGGASLSTRAVWR